VVLRTEYELVASLRETAGNVEQDFEFFLTITFALTFVSYAVGDKLGKMSKLSTVPTAKERKELEKLPRAKHIHFILLVVLIGIASLTFLFPDDIAPLARVLVGASICFVGVSTMSLQYFQRCPHCSIRMSRGRAVCAECGLEYYASESSTQEEG
jgi:hypothetical protein